MKKEEFIILCDSGLHARPATIFVEIAGKYSSEIHLEKDGDKVNAKSIIGVLTLGAGVNSRVILHVDGTDEDAAFKELASFFESGFDMEQIKR